MEDEAARYGRVLALFDGACDRPPAEREAWVHAECRDDSIAAEVLGMLAFAETSPARDWTGAGEAALVASLATTVPLPERIGSYRILERIGSGAMGEVFAAEQDEPRRIVALKVIRTALAGERLAERVRTEVAALARLDHPGIVSIYDAGSSELSDGSRALWFAMPRMEGEPLDVAARALRPRDRLRLIARCCDAVQHAHQRGVIHRDLKPANILVDPEGQPHILDFGVARTVSEDTTRHTVAGQVVGTLAYMSPEQTTGDLDAVDTRSDVYALGVMLYEVVARRSPLRLDGVPLMSALLRIQVERPRPLSRKIPVDVRIIIGKALEKESDRRYSSPQDLAEDLRRFLRDEPIRARPPSSAYVLGRWARRNKLTVAAGSVGLAALLAAIAAILVALVRTRRARDRAEVARREAEAVEDYLRSTLELAGPEGLGVNATVTEAVRVGAGAAAATLESHPRARARVQQFLADSLARGGLLDEAEEALRQAEEATDDTDTDRAIELGLTRVRLAASRGDDDAAVDQLTALRARAERHLGPSAPLALEVTTRLAEHLLHRGQRDRVVAIAADLRAAASTAGATGVPYVARAVVLDSAARPRRESREAVASAVADLAARLGPDHPTTAGARSLLARLHLDLDELDQAAPLLHGVWEAARRRFGPESVQANVAASSLVYTLLRLGRPGAALEVLDGLPAWESLVEGLAPEAAAIRLLAVAEAFRSVTRSDDAIAAAAAGLDRVPDGLVGAKLRACRARALCEAGRWEEALGALRDAHAHLVPFQPATPLALKLLKDIGSCLLNTGCVAEALAHFEAIEPRVVGALGSTHVLTRQVRRERGTCLVSLGRASEALPIALEVLAWYQERGAPLAIVGALTELGHARASAGDRQRGLLEIEQAWQAAQEAPDTPYRRQQAAAVATAGLQHDPDGPWRQRLEAVDPQAIYRRIRRDAPVSPGAGATAMPEPPASPGVPS